MIHKGSVTLETERLVLRSLVPEDAQAAYRWASDPETWKSLPGLPHRDIEETREAIEAQCKDDGLASYCWAIVPKAYGEAVGIVMSVRQDGQTLTLGYHIGKDWQGDRASLEIGTKALATEALLEIERFFFEEVRAENLEVCLDINSADPDTQTALQEAGLRLSGSLRLSRFGSQGDCEMQTWSISSREHFASQTLTFAPYDLEADYGFIKAAHLETFALTYKLDMQPERLAEELAKHRDLRDGAYLNGKLVGICDLERRSSDRYGEYGRACFFFVAPNLRNRGFGGQLVAHAAEWCRSQGLKRLTLNTGKDNLPAQRCYEKNGFVRFADMDRENELGYSMEIAPFAIRPMVLEDYDELYSLWLHTSGMGLNDVDDSRVGIAKYLARNPGTSFVATRGAMIAGAIMAGHDGRRGIIQHTAVRDDCRRLGIGSALVEAALAALEGEGISKVFLVAFTRNEIGNAFWEAQGFAERTDLTYRNKALVELVRLDT